MFSSLEQSEVMQSLPTIFRLQAKHVEYLTASEFSVTKITTRPLRESVYPIYLIVSYTYSEFLQRGAIRQALIKTISKNSVSCLLENFCLV